MCQQRLTACVEIQQSRLMLLEAGMAVPELESAWCLLCDTREAHRARLIFNR
jgi:hypothetical protein